ncbi:glycoside hydrolase family 43 protein [Taibaiella helva]|uniref:glycoside hydrolase family 43 protein n=1 Tax=Taibaiella helva TaxID=2301235 RepID=UPI000E572B7A|nr:glycoside hydrolase family 43 protein [Taibaiella helva]
MKIAKLNWRILIVSCLLSISFSFADAQSITLTNPILSGFYPDPSIVKTGDDYYLVNSTFSYFPGLPVFHSKDLKNWQQIGNVISRPAQLNFIGDKVTRGLFAPAISFHNGLYYVTCTNIDHKGNFLVTAKDPAGPWSDPVWLPDVRGIDPSLFFDDDDKAYILYNSDPPDHQSLYPGHRTIRMYELDALAGKISGAEKILINGGVDISQKPVWIEGPHIMKANGWYYLYAAEGGTSVNHSEVVFRSKSVWGPYISYEHNPILTQRNLPEDRKDPITSAGHAQFVEGPDGKTYAVFLAVRPYSGDYYNTGRETFIAPVEWKDGWPVINPGSPEIKYRYTAHYKEQKPGKILPQSGNFSYRLTFENGADPSLLFLRTVDSSNFSTGAEGLKLNLKPATCMGLDNPAFVGKRQQHLYCTTETKLDFETVKENEKAGLLAFQDERHFYYLCKSYAAGKPVVQLFKSNKDKEAMELLAEKPVRNQQGSIWLRIKAEGGSYSFYYAQKENQWNLLKTGVDGRWLSTHEAGGFTGCILAMYATSSSNSSNNNAVFRYLYYKGDDPMFRQ